MVSFDLLQDLMNRFFSGSSGTEKGTLFHLKNVFSHQKVSKEIGDKFNHTSDFITFVTHAYTVLAVVELLTLEGVDSQPSNHLEVESMAEDEKGDYILSVARKVVEMVWFSPNAEAVIAPTTADQYPFCICKTDNGDDEPMIECSGKRCRQGKLFHLDCIGMGIDDVPDGDWHCSSACLSTYPWCLCKMDKGKKAAMVACDNNTCPFGEWFHYECVGIDPKEKLGRIWYCSQFCTDNHNTVKADHKNLYVRALLFSGLMDLVRQDAIRENDGPAMMSHWRMDMIPFHNGNHNKHVSLGHRMLAAVSGWLPERLQRDIVWNRTVNLSGGPGKNLEMDLVNEFLNREFKQSLSDAGESVTREAFAHHIMVGGMGKLLDHIFEKQIKNVTEEDGGAPITLPKTDFEKDVHLFVELLKPERLFTVIEGRKFKSFPDFSFSMESQYPWRLHNKLKELSERLDQLDRVMEA